MIPKLFRPLSCFRAFFALFVLVTGIAHAATPTNVIITQVYGAGGNSGAVVQC